MGNKFNNFYEKCEKTVETSNKIEDLYQELADIELKYGKDSNEFIMLAKVIESVSLSENNNLNYFLSSPYVDYYEKYISSIGCDRLVDKINNNIELSKKEDDEFINHKLYKKIFNLIQSKKYVNVLDLYINKEKNKEIKKFLIDEKYDIIQRNSLIEEWYFKSSNLICMLVESDFLVSLETEINEKDYVSLKNNYYSSVLSKFLDLIYVDELDYMDKLIYETNIMSLLLCMNSEYTFKNLCEMKDDIRSCFASFDTNKFVKSMYTKYLKLEKKTKINYGKEELT